jgi:hypothetical protein
MKKNISNSLFHDIHRYFYKKGRNLLVRETFFTYFCRSTNKMKEYEHKTEKIYLARR